MKCEELYYYKNLLQLGYKEEYYKWLDHNLEDENPLSDIVLELSFCSSDTEKTISVLNDYCLDHIYDKSAVCDMFRLFFKDAYYSERMNKAETVSEMYRLYLNLVSVSNDFSDTNMLNDFVYLDEYYSMAQDGILLWENFDAVFFAFLDNGTPVDDNVVWGRGRRKSLKEKIRDLMKV